MLHRGVCYYTSHVEIHFDLLAYFVIIHFEWWGTIKVLDTSLGSAASPFLLLILLIILNHSLFIYSCYNLFSHTFIHCIPYFASSTFYLEDAHIGSSGPIQYQIALHHTGVVIPVVFFDFEERV